MAVNAESFEPNWELTQLLDIFPLPIRQALIRLPNIESVIEVVLDLGRRPEARFEDDFVFLTDNPVTHEDMAAVVTHLSPFGGDNRAGIEQTLHRISAIRNRSGNIVGLTCRVGRAVYGTIDIILDVIRSGKSICLLGRPGVGKTTMLRECARVLSEDRKRVVIVDTSNEIAGDGDVPHPGIGHARRMPVNDPLAATQRDDRSGRKPHAASDRHRRDRHRGRSDGRAHDRRTRRAADRHRARADAREPVDEPDLGRFDGRHQRRYAVRRRSAPARHAQDRARAQSAADVRRADRDPGPRPARDPSKRRRSRRRAAARIHAATGSAPAHRQRRNRHRARGRSGRDRRRRRAAAHSAARRRDALRRQRRGRRRRPTSR